MHATGTMLCRNKQQTLYHTLPQDTSSVLLLLLLAEWPNNTMRLGEFADVKYARMLVNLDRNCELNSANMLCYKNDDLSKGLQKGTYSENGERFDNLLQWAGWTQVGKLVGRDSQDAGACSDGDSVGYAMRPAAETLHLWQMSAVHASSTTNQRWRLCWLLHFQWVMLFTVHVCIACGRPA